MTDPQLIEPESTQDLVGVARDASTLSEVLATFEASGYTTDLVARDAGTVLCTECRAVSTARSFDVFELRRLEGASDPDDLLAVVAARCPICGARGSLVLQYGPTASADHMDVLLELEDPPAPTGVEI